MYARRLVAGLDRLGFIERTATDGLRPTERLNELLTTLDLSLTQLAPYSSRDTVVCAPAFGQPDVPPLKSDVFVLMPFAEELRPVYEDHIVTAVKGLGLSVARADDFFTADSIISDVWNAVSSAGIIVADCTTRNPNVFYELGIAHTLGKRAILIAQSATDIPFDVHHIRTIIYEFTPRGMKQFEEQLAATIKNERRWPESIEDWLDRDAVDG